MVSWGKAFGTAVKIVLVSILWYAIGIMIAIIVLIMVGAAGGLALLSDPRSLFDPALLSSLIAGSFLAITIGAVVSALGVAATYLKYTAELIAYEVQVRSGTPAVAPPTVRFAPAVSQSSKTCRKCGAQNDPTAAYCASCGNRMQN